MRLMSAGSPSLARLSSLLIAGATIAWALAPAQARADEFKDKIVIGAVLAPGAALVGGVFALVEKAYSDAADDHLLEFNKSKSRSCTFQNALCKDIDDDLEAADNARVGEIVSFITSGTLLVTGVILIAEAVATHQTGSASSHSDVGSVRVLPAAGPTGGGAVVEVQF
jgi:hypothetical protein